MKVKMICPTFWDGEKLKPGDEIVVDEKTAERWQSKRIAVVIAEENEPSVPALMTRVALESLSIEQLTSYAAAHNVDIGKAVTDKGILEKIAESGMILTDAGV